MNVTFSEIVTDPCKVDVYSPFLVSYFKKVTNEVKESEIFDLKRDNS